MSLSPVHPRIAGLLVARVFTSVLVFCVLNLAVLTPSIDAFVGGFVIRILECRSNIIQTPTKMNSARSKTFRCSLIFGFLFSLLSETMCQTDPSAYCGPGTIWSSTEQQCVPNPAIVPASYDGDDDGCVAVNDLLGLLSVFGDCQPEGHSIYWFKNTYGWPYATGEWTDETTEFYIQDCNIDSGYLITTDVTLALAFILDSEDSLVWCSDTIPDPLPVMPLDSLEGVSAISQSDIPTGTITIPSDTGPFYLIIPQSFEENALLLEESFFTHSYGWVSPAVARREVLVYGEPHWIYNFNAYGGLNVICGY
jgi:hypothetical protein